LFRTILIYVCPFVKKKIRFFKKPREDFSLVERFVEELLMKKIFAVKRENLA